MKQELNPKSHEWTRHERVIVFDGVCNWCNAWINFTIDHDPQGKFKLGTLQSVQAKQILQELQLSTDDFETFLLLEQTRVFTKSTAALRIARHLSGLWPLLYLFILIPRPLRDGGCIQPSFRLSLCRCSPHSRVSMSSIPSAHT